MLFYTRNKLKDYLIKEGVGNMKTPRIANAIGQIDDDLVAGAAKCKTKNKKHWLKWGSLAACFAVLVIAGQQSSRRYFGKM